MHPILRSNSYFVKERVGAFRASNYYDILDPDTQRQIMETREDISWFTKLLRFSDWKTMSPFNVVVMDTDGQQVCRVQRGFALFRSRVTVYDDADEPVGQFIQKLLSVGGAFRLVDMEERELGMLQGKWTSWEFSFKGPNEEELAKITKKFSGALKELFTDADNYLLTVNPQLSSESPARTMILAAAMCIDMVLKENR